MSATDRELRVLAGGSAPGAAVEPVSETGRMATTQNDYQVVVQWAVAPGAVGFLKEVSFVTNQPARTQWRLTIGGQVKWEDRLFQAPLAIPFPEDTQLAAEAVVALEARSTDGTLITADGSISGLERS